MAELLLALFLSSMDALPLPPWLHPDRVRHLNNKKLPTSSPSSSGSSATSATPGPALYWMQSSVRTSYNHALELAVSWANGLGRSLVVLFVLCETYPGANARSFKFMLEGLSETKDSLERRGIKLIVRKSRTSVPETVVDTCALLAAPLLITDRGYLRTLREWRAGVATHAPVPVVQVETDVVVPVERASRIQESSAASLRRKITPHLETFLQAVPEIALEHPSLGLHLPATMTEDLVNMQDPDAVLASLPNIDRSVRPIPWKKGGTMQAKSLLAVFMRDKLKGYKTMRKEMYRRHCSGLSAYIHYGHISVIFIALKVKQHKSSSAADRNKFVDELITNRELGINYCFYNPHYDSFEGLPAWAKASLEAHKKDARPALLTQDQLEAAQSPDPFWNVAQNEMVYDGYMHNYMRMYWAKQVLIWLADPREAYRVVVAMNDKYFLDGRDCNGYVGVAWCFGSTDRPMVERPIFGKVRFMTPNGLRSKHDVNSYAAQVRDIVDRARTCWGLPPISTPVMTTSGGPSGTGAYGKTSSAAAQSTDIRKFFTTKQAPLSSRVATSKRPPPPGYGREKEGAEGDEVTSSESETEDQVQDGLKRQKKDVKSEGGERLDMTA